MLVALLHLLKIVIACVLKMLLTIFCRRIFLHLWVIHTSKSVYMCLDVRKPVLGVSEQQRHRSAFPFVQSSQCLCYSLIEKYYF